jgi:anti-anti-sigma factor
VPPETVAVLALSGAADLASGLGIQRHCEQELGAQDADVVLDLHLLTFLSAAGIRMLYRVNDRLVRGGRQLALAAPTIAVARVLESVAADDDLSVFPTVAAAVAAHPGATVRYRDASLRPSQEHPAREFSARAGYPASATRHLPSREEVLGRRRDPQLRPVVFRAIGLLREGYGLEQVQAYALLRDASRAYDVAPWTLAGEFLHGEPAEPAVRRSWLSIAPPPPDVQLTAGVVQQSADRPQFLDSVLDAALACMGTGRGDIQLVAPAGNRLRTELQHGYSRRFAAGVAHLQDHTVGAAAWRRRKRVIVAAVATDPIFTGHPSREVMLAAGSRALQSTPLIASSGYCIGVVSTHDGRAGRTPTLTQHTELDRIAAVASSWLAWYQRTLLLDAVDYLHQRAATGHHRLAPL